MQPQPPPDAPAPPPSNEAERSQDVMSWIWFVGITSIVLLLALGATGPFVFRSHPRSDQTEAVSNARQIGLALFEFSTEYGKYPDASTIGPVRADTGSTLPLGTKTSNDFFRQLLAANLTQSERMFFAKINGVHKADDVITGANALSKGECGFSYIGGLPVAGDPSRPIAVTPLILGTDHFDPKRFDGKAIILRMDNSVISVPIDRDGHVMIDGKNMMSTSHPIWEGHPPIIAWPDL